MERILIIDGSNLLFQMFFGMPGRIVNKQGKAIQGTLGFVGALLKIIRKISPDYVVALFDGEYENRRQELDPDYKANRPDYSQVSEEETPFSQLPDVYAALDCLGIKHWETTDCEADDVIAAYVWKYGLEYEIIISSQDSDFFQLITKQVQILRYRGEKTVICTEDYIKEKLGIFPSQYADFKSMVGDPADNIKGAEKIGPKTAASLLKEFGTLENVLKNGERIKKPSIRESVLGNAGKLRTNYNMIKLGNGAALPFALEELKYADRNKTTNEVLAEAGIK